jgi:hypothetical protein
MIGGVVFLSSRPGPGENQDMDALGASLAVVSMVLIEFRMK